MDNTKENTTIDVEQEQTTFANADDFYNASVADPDVEIITDVELDKEEGVE